MLDDINNIGKIKRRILEEDQTIRLWDFSIEGLLKKKRDFVFSSDGFNVSIIDPFDGVLNPYLLSYETLAGINTQSLLPTVILDSNVMSLLNTFVSWPEKLPINKKRVVISLLDYFLLEKVDYNPGFYYMESFNKSSNENNDFFIKNSIKSILTLQTMNELTFLINRKIIPAPEEIEKYCYEYKVNDFDEVVEEIFSQLKERSLKKSSDWQLFYVFLLKSVLINKTSSKNFEAKMNLLYDFSYDMFGLLFARELSIAAFYFSGKIDGFISFQKGSNFEMSISRLRASAWDIYMLRLPELLLSTYQNPIPFATICTGDKSAQYIGSKFKIKRLLCNKDHFYPELEVNHSDLDIIHSNEDVVSNLFKTYNSNRFIKRKKYNTKDIFEKLPYLIKELESELKSLSY